MDGKTSLPVEEEDSASIAGNALGDQPTLVDRLGFKPYVDAIARFLTSDATQPPLSISIEGDWGSGKSSFLLQLEKAIGGARAVRSFSERLPAWLGGTAADIQAGEAALTVRFNAWRHDKQDALWAAFALVFVKSLRSEVGLVRAWRGNLSLFLKRLTGVKAWLGLCLLAVSGIVAVVGVIELYGFVSTHMQETRLVFDWLTKPASKTGGTDAATPGTSSGWVQLWQFASGGTFATMAAVGTAGLYKFRSYLKMPLALKLERYLAKPDYEGHASFIETFHLDLKRLVSAYAGKQRVFIFVDDLDRCDVPRAADLMQAINLMIGDTKNLVFILGMDREKVAAGIARKYKDILPFLRESAHWKINDEKDTYTPLYFGYSYLEKFIQISFSLPIPGDAATLDAFLREEPLVQQAPTWWNRAVQFWRPISMGLFNHSASNGDNPPPSPPIMERAPIDTVKIFNRVKIENDSRRIRNIVKYVSVLFEFNPRRIKQFTNTFRLALYIASDQGLFDQSDISQTVTTPEQIGKFVALSLRFPDLRFALERDSQLLGKLQELAFKAVSDREFTYHWLERPGTLELLTHGCEQGKTSGIYSLAEFDVTRLFLVLPRAAPPTTSGSDVAIVVFDNLARRYEELRATEPGGDARTRKMTSLAREALDAATRLSSPDQTLALLSSSVRPGHRLMRILIASEHKHAKNLPWLIEMNAAFVSPFEHYWCIDTLLGYVPLMNISDRAQVNASLQTHWDQISSDAGRAGSARRLLQATRDAASDEASAVKFKRSSPGKRA